MQVKIVTLFGQDYDIWENSDAQLSNKSGISITGKPDQIIITQSYKLGHTLKLHLVFNLPNSI
jgi:hypothetical protein